MQITLKRIYDPPSRDDGYRVLVDRLWPRGISKEKAKIDEWAKSIAPSTDLRVWFHKDRSQWAEFKKRYLAELKPQRAELQALIEHAGKGRLTLLFASTDAEQNHATVIKQYLERIIPK